MKSSFLLPIALMLPMSAALAQTALVNKASIQMKNAGPATQAKKAAPKSAATTVVNPATQVVEKSTFEKFSSRLRIGYWAAFTTPTLYDMTHGNWESAAISPEFDRQSGAKETAFRNQDTWPTNLWNQISFNYNFGAKLNFVVNPRFMVPIGSSRNMDAPEDKSFIMLDDMLVGFQGVVLASDDKKFNLWIRPGVRLPTSRASRNSGQGGFGSLTHQLELAYLPTYDFNKKWQLGVFGQIRQWTFEQRYTWARLRLYTAPFVQYSIDDTTRVQVYYETMLENRRRWKSVNGQKQRFEDVWQNVMIGVNKDITPKFNVFPFVGFFADDLPHDMHSMWFGAWISYAIK